MVTLIPVSFSQSTRFYILFLLNRYNSLSITSLSAKMFIAKRFSISINDITSIMSFTSSCLTFSFLSFTVTDMDGTRCQFIFITLSLPTNTPSRISPLFLKIITVSFSSFRVIVVTFSLILTIPVRLITLYLI